jgi:branched-chain amino acid transport system permease protein
MSRSTLLYLAMGAVLIAVGLLQSWQLALTIVNLCLISAVMALGVNVQWGVAGMFNVGTMGSAAAGSLAVVLISAPPVRAAWDAGGQWAADSGAAVRLSGRRNLWHFRDHSGRPAE